MFKNYLIIALRNIKRYKGYSFINITGLALGMTSCILTMIWAQYEYSFDGFHRNAKSIYRVISENPSSHVAGFVWGAPPSLGSALADEYPEVVNFSRYWNIRRRDAIRSHQILDPRTQVCYVDPAFFTIFDFKFLEGDPKSVLHDPNSVILTQSAAIKFFGDENPLGKTLQAFGPDKLMKVTGILKDIPENSHIQFDIVVPFWAMESENWKEVTYDLYLQLKSGTQIREFESKIQECIKRHHSETVLRTALQSLKEIHFQPNFESAWWRYSEKKWIVNQIHLFILVSLAVLSLAAINSINLSTARSLKRIKAIGVRKVNGAGRIDIFKQSMTESMLGAFLALSAAVVLSMFLLPLLRDLTGRRLDLYLLNRGQLGLSLLGITLATGFLSGLYPALFASSFNPVKALGKTLRSGRLSLLLPRRVLVSFQFLCSTVLVIVTTIFLLQMDYANKKDLGYDKKNLVIVRGINSASADVFKTKLEEDPSILSVTFSDTPTMGSEGHRFDFSGFQWAGKSADDETFVDLMGADEDFLETYGISMVAGRFFSKEFSTDENNVVLNESAVKAMGISDPVGKMFEVLRGRPVKGQIVGVVKDYHISSLRAKIRPLVIEYFRNAINGIATIRISGSDPGSTLQFIEESFKQFQPERPFHYEFLEDMLASHYLDDRTISRVIICYGFFSLVIAGLGLVGLIALVTEQRTKEIGVRKVFGASVVSVVYRITSEFMFLVGVASILACPIGFFIGSKWLANFAYRIHFSIWLLVGAFLFVMLFAFVTIVWQSSNAARKNPVDSLRYE